MDVQDRQISKDTNDVVSRQLASGLTESEVRPDVPVLFGSADAQALLLNVAINRHIEFTGKLQYTEGFIACGILLVRRDGDARYLCLDIRHPKIVLIKQTLEDLAGHVLTDSPWSHTERARGRRTPRVCIAVRNIFVLRVFIETGLPLSLNAVIARISHMTPRSVKYVVGLLHSDGLLTKREGEGYTISARVPLSYLQLVTELAEEASVKDKRFDVPSVPTGRAERGGYTSASDGAPRLFIGDNRLRNLMALAKYGPLTQRELTDVTGVFRNMNESRNVAQFTRSDVVRVWETERGLAAMCRQLLTASEIFLMTTRS